MNSAYLEDASGFRGHADAIYTPSTEDEIADILRRAAAGGTAVTIAGAGTGVTGGRVPLGGWVISMEKLAGIDFREESAIAGPGALLKDLQAEAARRCLFYAPDPTEWSASVGGTVATNASGSRSFRYGDTRRHVLGLRVLLADGRLLAVRRGDKVDFPVPAIPLPRTTKHAAGYRLEPGMDWVDLFIGSEGTLGVLTQAELRLLPSPEHLLAGVVFFPEDAGALEAVDDWRGIEGLRMLEYFDAASLRLLADRYPEVPAMASAALLIEQEMRSAAGDEIDLWLDRLEQAGALADESWFGASAADRERFRRFRHALPELVNDRVRRNGALKMGTDFAVPLASNAAMMRHYHDALEQEFPGRYLIFGHIGDAHVHVNLLPENPEESARAQRVILDLARHAVALGGTVSAEHGLGKRKAHLLEVQYATEHIQAMREVKRRLDPQGLLGRGTLFSP